MMMVPDTERDDNERDDNERDDNDASSVNAKMDRSFQMTLWLWPLGRLLYQPNKSCDPMNEDNVSRNSLNLSHRKIDFFLQRVVLTVTRGQLQSGPQSGARPRRPQHV